MAKLTSDEILAAEKAKDDRVQSRKQGFSTMSVRDKGWHRLSNGIVIEWPVARPLEEGEVRRHVPEGKFILTLDNESVLFDAEEFRKWVRWA